MRTIVKGTENYDELGANYNKAVRHGMACGVKKVLTNSKDNTREICHCTQSCGQYVPEEGDTYEVFGTNTDELWHLGIGYPLHFLFQRHMAGMLLFVSVLYCLPIIVQSILIFYETLDIQGSERKNTGILIYGSYFSLYQLRLSYGFDFGVWANNNYWYI